MKKTKVGMKWLLVFSVFVWMGLLIMPIKINAVQTNQIIIDGNNCNNDQDNMSASGWKYTASTHTIELNGANIEVETESGFDRDPIIIDDGTDTEYTIKITGDSTLSVTYINGTPMAHFIAHANPLTVESENGAVLRMKSTNELSAGFGSKNDLTIKNSVIEEETYEFVDGSDASVLDVNVEIINSKITVLNNNDFDDIDIKGDLTLANSKFLLGNVNMGFLANNIVMDNTVVESQTEGSVEFLAEESFMSTDTTITATNAAIEATNITLTNTNLTISDVGTVFGDDVKILGTSDVSITCTDESRGMVIGAFNDFIVAKSAKVKIIAVESVIPILAGNAITLGDSIVETDPEDCNQMVDATMGDLTGFAFGNEETNELATALKINYFIPTPEPTPEPTPTPAPPTGDTSNTTGYMMLVGLAMLMGVSSYGYKKYMK